MMGVVLAASAVLAAACSSGGGSSASAQALKPGELLTSRPLTDAAALPGAAGNKLITYMSDDSSGNPIVVSGTVSVPKSAPPKGGWPVISWAHGTTGYADTCAPSADTTDGPDHDYLGPVDTVLNQWLDKGYAVVQTDYQGLGTPGGHPYVDGTSEANTVIDIVRAARQLDSSIGKNWAVVGHSQGGQAALFTAQDAKKRAPELDLKAAVSIAPGGVGLSQTVDYVKTNQPGAEAAEAFLPVMILGAAAADPAINPDAILSPEAKPLLTAARTGCLAQIREVKPIPPTQFFAPGADLAPVTNFLKKQDPDLVSPAVPTMIAQGTADTVVAKPGTDALVKTYCGKGIDLDYRTYPGQDHRGSVPASLQDAQDFVAKAMAGQKTPTTCQA
ncbi:alpha/beta fold hydrolase [Rhodococcus sp. D2-41]|uniref:alpha/beta hydrolase family protein n=1 Tax=Speluncibacter jeojiensis TaxID=2710754 RepID=UPI00240F24CD|nr:alpha/beta fold hydrolase [Rhodococcus sp. D2-41]MDG3008874.1 alpha/beta fold hydrolase [Rhodococcus sp. D2-41]